MTRTPSNPFNITKAVDFTDEEIHEYWVDIPTEGGFAGLAKPTSPMPMFILGGKGSGKTHLMRHFSYPLQRIRYRDDPLAGFQRDGYIGVYLRCRGLNAERFRDKGHSEDVWADVFAYYMELWLAQLTLKALEAVLVQHFDNGAQETLAVADMCALINAPDSPSISSLADLAQLLRTLQRDVDDAVNNVALSGELPVRVAVTRGSLIFGIPRIVIGRFAVLRSVRTLYLIDEFENLSAAQQKYINTLVREREGPCSFRIGSRMYGVRTHHTYSADEENKSGSEFEVLHLDGALRENKRYNEFARLLIATRLSEYKCAPSSASAIAAAARDLDGFFDEPADSTFSHTETAYVIDAYAGKQRPYFDLLQRQLVTALRTGRALGLRSDEDVEEILSLLSAPEYPLLEKANVFLLYGDWSDGRDLVQAARSISADCVSTMASSAEPTRQRSTLSHFKSDLLAQLLRDTRQRQRYVGLKTFIDMSCGLPRHLLVVLKHIYGWSLFLGERPFEGERISMRAQQAGVQAACEWFYGDARMMGSNGHAIVDAVERLATLFRSVRFSNKPSECACSTFSVDLARLSADARTVLDLAQKWSFLVDVGGQRDRNTERIDAKLQINPMLAPRWDLSIYRRGALALAPDEVDAIFNPLLSDSYPSVLTARLSRMTAPFGAEPNPSDQGPLLFEQ